MFASWLIRCQTEKIDKPSEMLLKGLQGSLSEHVSEGVKKWFECVWVSERVKAYADAIVSAMCEQI